LILLNPGPVTLSERVKNALSKPDLCHREIEFFQLQNNIREKLLKIYNLDPHKYASILLTGSGTSAMEAMISSLIPTDGKLLVIENGVYGERLSKIAKIHGLNYLPFHLQWGEEIDLHCVEICLRNHQDITHLAVVHHETTTGRLNHLAPISHLCKRYNIKLLVDGVSSFGAEDLDFENWNILACAATANKCLHSIPGTSFVIVEREALKVNLTPRTLYLDLLTYCAKQDNNATPFTQSVQSFYALEEALSELEEEGGYIARKNKYQSLMNYVRNQLINLGIKPLLSQEDSSIVLNSFYLPEGITYNQLHDYLKANGFIIYAGQGELAKTIFRISIMGDIFLQDLDKLIDLFKQLIYQ
jgi:2-aminoethylphosphonate-pyruvate transaminase